MTTTDSSSTICLLLLVFSYLVWTAFKGCQVMDIFWQQYLQCTYVCMYKMPVYRSQMLKYLDLCINSCISLIAFSYDTNIVWVCMYVYICIFTCICTYVCVQICMYVCMYMRLLLLNGVCTIIKRHGFVLNTHTTNPCIEMNVCTFIYLYMHVCVCLYHFSLVSWSSD